MKTAIDINSGICCPFVAVLSLASVLCSPIKLLCKDIVDKRLMGLYTCIINPRENVDENNKMYLFWTSTDDRVDKLDHFVPLMNDLYPPPLKQTKYVKSEVYVPVTNSLLEGIFMDIGKKSKKFLVKKGKWIKSVINIDR